jgi:hypothetical protein
MRIGKSNINKHQYKLKEDGNTPNRRKILESQKYEKLSFDKHISEKVNKANSIMGLIRWTMEYMDNNSFKLLYTALVIPHLEYANQVWCPHQAKHKDEIENEQRRATKQLSGMSNLSYPERLQKLKLPTLAYRRIRGDMIELFKILTGKYDHEVSDFIQLKGESSSRGHNYKIFKICPRLNIKKYSFIH